MSRYPGSERGRSSSSGFLRGPQASVWNVPWVEWQEGGPSRGRPRPEEAPRAHVHSLPLKDSYIQTRADTMQNIESTIVELGSIFQQLAHMVKEQEETIQR